MPQPTAMNSGHAGANQDLSVTGVIGTLGTADTGGTALPLPIGVDPATGAAYVYNLGPAGTTTPSGTQAVNIIGGTVGTILGIGGTVQVSGASAGTYNNIVTGTQQTLGTVGTVAGVGIVTRIGNIGTIESGTVTTTLALNSGTISTIIAGTQNTLGTLGVLNSGTLNALATGTITAGTVSVTTGTIVGPVASGGSETGAPVPVGGTDSGGTVRLPLITSAGYLNDIIQNGTINNVGTVVGAGVVTTVSNLTSGSVNILTGTLQSAGTTTGVGVLSNLTNGSINILTGTLQSSGTTTGVGVVTTLTAMSLGTITGVTANAGSYTGNPVGIGGTDSGGTIRLPLVTSVGYFNDIVQNGTITNVGTLVGAGVVTTVSGLTNGSINILTGTLQSAGTVTGVGTVTNLGSITNIGSIAAGNLTSSGTTTGVGVVSNLTNGSVNILSGTTTLVSTVTTLSNLTNGSINILSGTLQSAGTTTGVGVVSNLTNGSVNVLTGTVTSVANLAGGTVQINPTPVPTPLILGTLGTAGGSLFGTLSAASGAGTKHYISGLSVVQQSGTSDVRILAGSSIQGTGVLAAGQFTPGGGMVREFNPVFSTGTNSELIYHFVGAGTAFICINYWKGV